MKISIEAQHPDDLLKVTIEISDDSTIDEVMDNWGGLLVAYGFHPNSVRDGFMAKGEEYEEEIQDKTK